MTIDPTDDFDMRNISLPENEAKRKWRNLLDQFAKELKKVREPRSGDPSDEDGNYRNCRCFRRNCAKDENTPSQSTATPRFKRKAPPEKKEDVEQQLLNIEAKKLALLETPEDENSLFLRSLLPYFQKMDPLQQLRVRNKFQDILIQEMSPPSTSSHSENIHFRQHHSTAVSSVASSTYSNVSSPPSSADSAYLATHFQNMYPL
ncbi:uncharacterized protein LOC130898095 [Diorhabda carinulata]|uniref:uncharacterized protein LOC130898095 n=1 Tax=Diorhabda carinulata TaxID=1163345 RepID=UPI0025A02794|nr:uncharacterized protein LOC130898095 [Diorhabda carinulata]